jgi:hypothetical protein
MTRGGSFMALQEVLRLQAGDVAAGPALSDRDIARHPVRHFACAA